MENNPNDSSEEKSNNKEKKAPRKRVKKCESGKRNFICKTCGKAYLTHPALYTHCLIKHGTKIKTENSKGRPRNNPENDKEFYDPKKPIFFNHEKRKGKTPIENINACTKRAFIFIYGQNKEKLIEMKNTEKMKKMKIYNNIEENPFLSKFINKEHTEKIIDKNEKIDNVLIYYLNQMSNSCNETYYEKLIIFIILLREFINIFHERSDNKEYTTINSAIDVPDMGNDFINEFLFFDGNEIIFDLEKQEVIDLTTNLCSWMYTHDFTDFKIYLYGEEENNDN